MDFDGENKVYAPQKEADAFENVSGEVADVVYQNKESGWGVIVVDDAGSPVTAVGYLAGVWGGGICGAVRQLYHPLYLWAAIKSGIL